MDTAVQTLGSVVLATLVLWFVAGPLLRLAAASCFICAAGLLAIGDHISAVGVTGCGTVCWTLAQLLYRAFHGRWRTARAARLLGRTASGPSNPGGPPGAA